MSTELVSRCVSLVFGHGGAATSFTDDQKPPDVALAGLGYPHLRFEEGSAYDDLALKYGRFPVVISLEVVEHVYAPRDYARTLFDLVEPGGTAIVSTPYHGYRRT